MGFCVCVCVRACMGLCGWGGVFWVSWRFWVTKSTNSSCAHWNSSHRSKYLWIDTTIIHLPTHPSSIISLLIKGCGVYEHSIKAIWTPGERRKTQNTDVNVPVTDSCLSNHECLNLTRWSVVSVCGRTKILFKLVFDKQTKGNCTVWQKLS